LKAISSEEYQKRSNELTERLSSLSVKESDTAGKLSGLESEYQKAEADMKQIIRYSHIEELTQEVVDTFIRRVYAYKDKRIEIEWNFSMDCGVSQANGT
jgi:site-specific DNA recombinase